MADSEISRYGRKVMNYFFDSAPRNDISPSTPIYCLGIRYDTPPPPQTETNAEPVIINHAIYSPSDSTAHGSELTSEPEEITKSQAIPSQEKDGSQRSALSENGGREDEGGWPTAFLDDFESRIWMTYRSNFAPIPRSQDPKATASMSLAVRLRSLASQEGFTSDTGWGCMIRSGQSLLANALLLSMKGRSWRLSQIDEDEQHIISLFADDPKAPFSIHNFVSHGAEACGKHPGEWFGPSATARCIKALVNKEKSTNLSVYITADGSDVYEDEVFQIASAKNGSFQPILILVGTRLGLDRVTPVYWEALKAALQVPQAIGIAGGRPSASHYFIGTQGNDFFYLDPHHTRPGLPYRTSADAQLNPLPYTVEEMASLHTRRIRRLNINGMDPSMLLGFLIKDEADWKDWRRAVSEVPGKAIVHVHDSEGAASGSLGGAIGTTGTERKGAIDEVETFDTEEDDDEL